MHHNASRVTFSCSREKLRSSAVVSQAAPRAGMAAAAEAWTGLTAAGCSRQAAGGTILSRGGTAMPALPAAVNAATRASMS